MGELKISTLEDGCTSCGGRKRNNRTNNAGGNSGPRNDGNYNIINIGNDIMQLDNQNSPNGSPSAPPQVVTNTHIKEIIEREKQLPGKIIREKVPVTGSESLLYWQNDVDNRFTIPVRLFNHDGKVTTYKEFY